ncbi:MAG TPA: hypothetical protein VFS18_01025 [Actinomycetota bacterium]|nr:hypothetical protein [Actinomycetota bacterium]
MSLKASRMILALTLALSTTVLLPGVSEGARVRFRATAGGAWDPDFRHVERGTKVIWKNPTDRRHTVTAYGRGWDKHKRLDPGERTKKTFRRNGVYKFRCKLDSTLEDGVCSGMCGEVHVGG